MERKLTTIICADVVGFSKMMESDEEGTLSILESCRSIIDPMTIEYGGRLFNTGGDSVLLDFSSTVNAVKFAIECQKQLQARNAQNANLPIMTYRFGIHIGDVVIQNSNLMGDGVNLAARIEALADYGGVTMSEIVYQQVRTRIPNVSYIDRGNQAMKNISDTIRLYSVEIQGAIKNPNLKANSDHIVSDKPENEEKAISPDKQSVNSSNNSNLTLKSISLNRALQSSTFEQATRLISHRDYEQATLMLTIQLTKKNSQATEELLHLATNKLIPEQLFGVVIEGLEYVAKYSTHEKLFQIGALLKDGIFGKENQSKFIRFWEMSAAEYGTAQYELGKFILESPKASDHHKNQAIDFLSKATRKKNTAAAMLLGGFFSNQLSSFYTPAKAFENLWLARSWHDSKAQMQLHSLANTITKKDFEMYKINAETILDQINFENQYNSR